MMSDYVVTEHDAKGGPHAEDGVALASYPLDSHGVTLYVDETGQPRMPVVVSSAHEVLAQAAVGALIADEATGEIIARGCTQAGGRPHAEAVVLAQAGERARGKTMYVTLEPCSHHGRTPPCADAIIAAGLKRVVLALGDPDPRVSGRGLDRLAAAGIEVERGLMADEARAITRGHILRVTERRPLVQLKLALSADGAIAHGKDGKPLWVTSPEARAHGHRLRAEADAILVGAGTVTDDDPDLTCRLPGLEARSPVRVVLSGQRSRLASARMLTTASRVTVWIYTDRSRPADPGLMPPPDGVTLAPVVAVGGRLWLPAVLEDLVARGVTRLLVEGGPGLWAGFAAAGLVDEIALYVARGDGAAADAEAARRHLARYGIRVPLALAEQRPVGRDIFFQFRRI